MLSLGGKGEIHEKLGKGLLNDYPGVRFKGGDVGDQKRVMSPADAKDAGSDYIVRGAHYAGGKSGRGL